MSSRQSPPHQSLSRLSLESLEAREVPAQYTLSLSTSPPTTNTSAQVTGLLHLNSAYPSLPDHRILVDAASPVEAVRKGGNRPRGRART